MTHLPPDRDYFVVLLCWNCGGLKSGDGDGLGYSPDMLFWVVLHTVTFRSPMYGLCWLGSGCIAN